MKEVNEPQVPTDFPTLLWPIYSLMTMMLAAGALVCAWVFLRLLSTERERSNHQAEASLKAALTEAAKQAAAQQAAQQAAAQAEAAGQREKLDVAAARH
jgi:hypothetical protein